jgi:class 3 adenylate cyclase
MISMRCVIVFVDVHDFSKAAVLLGDRLASFVQDFYQTLGECIVGAHGTIVKYMGDMIMSVFADKAEVAAVRCGLEMRNAMARLVEKWHLPPATELEVGIGAGRVDRGTFGHESLRTEDVFGEEVSVTAMICHHRGVAITESVRDRVKESFRLTPLGPHPLKWRSEPAKVWAVEGEASTSPARG